ncbi:hypothetical protein J132_01349 [Termitomyces sp. J132]|nr:hypothetical protein J132_01349 [Termitomyces sp. J132]
MRTSRKYFGKNNNNWILRPKIRISDWTSRKCGAVTVISTAAYKGLEKSRGLVQRLPEITLSSRTRQVTATDVKDLSRRRLLDVLKEPVDYDPIIFSKSSSTTDVFASSSEITREALNVVVPRLTHIIPHSNLVRQLVPEFYKAIEDVWVQAGDRLSIRIDPKYTTAPLTRAIYSEKDSEDIFLGLYLYPALSLIGFLKAREKLKKEDSSKKYTNDEIMDYKELKKKSEFYAASFGGAAHIADLGVYELLSNDEPSQTVLHLPTEVKTPVAFPEAALDQISPRISSADPEHMTEENMKKIEGWAIQFSWPKLHQNFGGENRMKHNKVISQVWNQMVEHKQRKDHTSGHLYISPPCYPLEDGLMDTMIWTLRASGYLHGSICVPTVIDGWWKKTRNSGEPGVNTK